MSTHHFHQLVKQQICLLAEKCLFWPDKEMLIIADVHLGKVMHFRKAGIPIPTKAIKKNLFTLQQLFTTWQPKRVIFLGDLFHSSLNSEWHYFESLMDQFPSCQFELVLGNHDAYTQSFMEERLITYPELLLIPPFSFTHIPLNLVDIPPNTYNLSGHLHPAMQFLGKGKQRLQFPCFFFGPKQGVLPAFGAFTGFINMKTTIHDEVFPIVEGKVLDVGKQRK